MHIGWYAGMSVVQGGPGFLLLSDAAYHYLHTINMPIADENLLLMINCT